MKTLSALKSRPISYVNNWYDTFLDPVMVPFSQHHSNTVFNPRVNIIEKDDRFELALEIPGYDKDEINIQIDHRQLRISGAAEKDHKTDECKNDESKKYRLREFSKKSFIRTFNLGESIDTEKVTANFSNGILTLKLEKKEANKATAPRKIEIE